MTAPALHAQDLTVRHHGPRGPVTAVRRVSLELPAGRTTGLVGESGSGKSTLARALVGLCPPHGGRVLVDGRPVRVRTVGERRWLAGRVQMVFQDPDTSLDPRMTVRHQLTEAVTAVRRPDRDARQLRVAELLELVGLDADVAPRLPRELSGGQRQRVALARALAVEPRVLIADEMTSALDAPTQAAVLGTLRGLQRRLGLTVLFISHSLSAVRRMSDLVAVMYLGRIVEHAEAEELFRSPRHPYTRMLLDAEPTLAVRTLPSPRLPGPPRLDDEAPDPAAPPRGCPFHPRCPAGPRHRPDRVSCGERDPQPQAPGRPHRAACHFPLTLGRDL